MTTTHATQPEPAPDTERTGLPDDNAGPGYEDGPWAAGWAERTGLPDDVDNPADLTDAAISATAKGE